MRRKYAHIKCVRVARKYYLAMQLGGACSVCGYNENMASLVFHHQCADDKLIEINGPALSDNPLPTLEAEIKKCVLLCANCHNTAHNSKLTAANIKAMMEDITLNKISYASAAIKYLSA